MTSPFKQIKARSFAPASVGNLAVGFDLLGFALHQIGDIITLSTEPQLTTTTKTDNQQIIIEQIKGDSSISFNAKKNTASAALAAMLNALKITSSLYLSIQKGIPGGSGLGSSAASAVAAVVALNGLLSKPVSEQDLFEYALIGENVAATSIHGDNVGASLRGGITLTTLNKKKNLFTLPNPKELSYLVIAPNCKLTTATARNILKKTIPLTLHVQQSGYLAQFILALHQSNYPLIKESLKDITIEPQRAHLIPNFLDIKTLILEQEALGCSISGAGPAIFALFKNKNKAEQTKQIITNYFIKENLIAQIFINDLSAPGAYLIT